MRNDPGWLRDVSEDTLTLRRRTVGADDVLT